jgi:hypothetical protein
LPVPKMKRSRGNEASIKPQTTSRTRKPQEQAAVGKPQLARTQVEQAAKRERREVSDGVSEACGVDSPSGGTYGLTCSREEIYYYVTVAVWRRRCR